ncbi:MAG TPA: nitrate reductase associated protein [Blastocatellia bacterium]|jgi:hypothetical protein
MEGTARHFQFEADFVASLRCIPMYVRFKLDAVGLKLKLSHWAKFSLEDRQVLAETPCETAEEIDAYKLLLSSLALERTGEALQNLPAEYDADWKLESAPERVLAKAGEIGVSITRGQWAALPPLQRFALVKLVRSGHEGHNFGRALREFGLL